MDSNSNEKKPKRPRIGQSFRTPDEGTEARPRFNSGNDAPADGAPADDNGFCTRRPYQPRPYNNQGGYNRPQRPYNNYNSGYNRNYNHRSQNTDYNSTAEGTPDAHAAAEGEQPAEGAQQYQRPYQPRQPRPYNGQNGYNRQNRPYNGQNGYNRQNQGSYNNRQGGYNNQQGGYNRQGGYNNRQQDGGYNNNRQGGYNHRQQGGYNRQNQQGGYNKYNNNRRPNQNNNNGFPGRGKSFTPRPKRIEYEMPVLDPNEQIRLNKYMSNAGICSRREADEFIQQGLVKVNGEVVTELGTKITHSDVVEYDGKVVALESKCYILLNKPKDCVTTSDDPNGRLTVMDLVKGACNERIYPVGRLDRNTTGVLLLTNDGDLASKLTHPKYVKKKIYHVWCDRDIAEEDMQRIADGIELEDGPIHADAISYATETDRNQAGIEIHSGRNRIVRRIFESLGYHVTKLDRVYFAGLTKKNLPRGRWRYLTQEEVNYLKMGSFE